MWFHNLPACQGARGVLFVLAAVCSGTGAMGQMEEYVTGIEADKLVINSEGTLFWKASAALFPSNPIRISSLAVDAATRIPERVILVSLPAYPEVPISGEIATSEGSPNIFFIHNDGRFCRDTHSYFYRSLFSVPDVGRISAVGQISMVADGAYFTDETGEFLDQARLWVKRSPLHGSTPPELVADRTSGPNATWFRDIIGLNEDKVITLTGNRRLSIFERSFLAGNPVWLQTNYSTDAICMTRHRRATGGDRLVWANINGAGTQVNFYSAPIDNLAASTSLGSEVVSTFNAIDSMTVADNELYYQISSGSSGPLRRRSALGFRISSDEIAALPYSLEQICSSDRFICWLRNRNTIVRMPVGAAAISRNLAAHGMEVIQAIQNTANDVQLVADKPTHVRVMARIAASTAGETSLTLAPPMVLHGLRGTTPLPGSPLVVNYLFNPPPPVQVTATNRMDQAHGYWFRLPDSWTTHGTITLRAVLNPSRVYSETDYADNIVQRTATFTQKVPIGLKIIPTRTIAGVTRRRGDHRELFDQAAHLLPTSSLRVEYARTGFIEDYAGAYTFAPGDGNDDKDLVIIALLLKKIVGAGGTLAEPGGFDHYMSLLQHEAFAPGVWWAGWSNSGDTVSATGIPLIVKNSKVMDRGPMSYDNNGVRDASLTLVHELGHNYGRMHVGGCPGASFTDPAYPYAGGTISDLTAGHLGFNAYKRRLLPLWGTGDFMTYCSEKWPSPYTWQAIYNRVSTGYGPALRPPRSLSSPGITAGAVAGMTAGIIETASGTASMRAVYGLGSVENARALEVTPPVGARYVLKGFQNNSFKRDYPVGVFGADTTTTPPTSHVCGQDSPDGRTGWMSITDTLIDIDRLELHDLQALPGTPPLAVRTGGGAAPTVTVTEPSGGIVMGDQLLIEWTSSDDASAPLTHFVRISNDDGMSWRSLAEEVSGNSLLVPVADLPGGALCRIEVIASDGILCGRGVSAPFTVENKPPEANILFENETRKINVPLNSARFEYGERIILHAEADDLEDGWLPTSALRWEIYGPLSASAPATRTATGRRHSPQGLLPGMYNLALNAVDSAVSTQRVLRAFTVRHPYVETASSPVSIDGYVEEPAYASDRWPKAIRYTTGEVARVSMVRDADALCIAVSGLRTTGSTNTTLTVCLDGDFFAPNLPSATSRLIRIRPNGAAEIMIGDGTAWLDATNTPGIVTAVSGGPAGWNAEIRIPEDLLPYGFNSGPARIFAGQMDVGTPGTHVIFPAGANENDPSTWLEFMMGPDYDNPADLDGDGMPDQWETTLAGPGGTDESGDQDHDGQTDYEEFVAGTIATFDGSRFTTDAFSDAGNGVQLSWPSASGRTYSIWRSTDMVDFELIAETISGPPYAGSAFWTDANPPEGVVYYKVEAHYYR